MVVTRTEEVIICANVPPLSLTSLERDADDETVAMTSPASAIVKQGLWTMCYEERKGLEGMYASGSHRAD